MFNLCCSSYSFHIPLHHPRYQWLRPFQSDQQPFRSPIRFSKHRFCLQKWKGNSCNWTWKNRPGFWEGVRWMWHHVVRLGILYIYNVGEPCWWVNMNTFTYIYTTCEVTCVIVYVYIYMDLHLVKLFKRYIIYQSYVGLQWFTKRTHDNLSFFLTGGWPVCEHPRPNTPHGNLKGLASLRTWFKKGLHTAPHTFSEYMIFIYIFSAGLVSTPYHL